jgi:hypothetical protein
MGIGLETLFHLVYEFVHWVKSWCVPDYEMIEAHEMAVKVTGAKITVLEPGGTWVHSARTTIYKDNIRRKVREPSDVVATTKDGVTVRVGISFAFVISNIETWLTANEDAEQGLLVDVQRVVLKFVRQHTFEQIQNLDEDSLSKLAQKELGRYFGVRVKGLGITTFAKTELRDLNHSGYVPGIAATATEDPV